MRGRLIFQFLAELYRLDSFAMATEPHGPHASGYDPDFKEPVLFDADGDGVAEPFRREHPPIRVPCQVSSKTFEEMRMTPAGNSPRSDLELVFHFRDLERLGLVDATSGEALIRPSDRLGGLYDLDGNLVQKIRGLYVTEARIAGFGLSRRRPRRNLLIVSFEDRPAARGLS